MSDDIDTLKQQVARACQILGRLHLTREPNGHVSVRIPGTDRVIIKARGRAEAPLSYTTVDDLCIVDLDARLIEAREGLAAPSETFIHTTLLKARPELNSVIHIHSAAAVAFTIAEKPLLPIIGAFNPAAIRLVIEGIPTYPRSVLINSEERGNELVALMGKSRVALMRGHGIAVAGATVEDATLTAVHLSELADLQLKAEMLGGAKPISDEDLAEFTRMGSTPTGGATQPSSTPQMPSAEWRYYDQLFR